VKENRPVRKGEREGVVDVIAASFKERPSYDSAVRAGQVYKELQRLALSRPSSVKHLGVKRHGRREELWQDHPLSAPIKSLPHQGLCLAQVRGYVAHSGIHLYCSNSHYLNPGFLLFRSLNHSFHW